MTGIAFAGVALTVLVARAAAADAAADWPAALEVLLSVYVAGVVVSAFIGALLAFLARDDDARAERRGARLALLSPVWPALALGFIWVALVELWDAADWGYRDDD